MSAFDRAQSRWDAMEAPEFYERLEVIVCDACDGSGKQAVREECADGVTRTYELDCEACNGQGKEIS